MRVKVSAFEAPGRYFDLVDLNNRILIESLIESFDNICFFDKKM